jgi:hypothetical protein
LAAAELRELNRGPVLRRFVSARALVSPPRLLSVSLAAAAAAVFVVVVLAVLGAIDNNDADRRPQPVGTVPGKKVVAPDLGSDLERGVRFSLDGRVLTVQLLPPVRNQTFDTVSGAQISATCRANVDASPDNPRGGTTVTRRWPAGQTSMSFRFPQDVSSWCQLEDQSGSIVASVRFPGAWSDGEAWSDGDVINETVINWARLIAANPQTCNDYMRQTACEQIKCRRAGGTPIQDCRPIDSYWAATFRDASVQGIVIDGDRAGREAKGWSSARTGSVEPDCFTVARRARDHTREFASDQSSVIRHE